MEWWLILLIVLVYALVTVIVTSVIGNLFYRKNWIENQAEADSFGFICGFFWPILPFILLCFRAVKYINRLFER